MQTKTTFAFVGEMSDVLAHEDAHEIVATVLWKAFLRDLEACLRFKRSRSDIISAVSSRSVATPVAFASFEIRSIKALPTPRP